ncbi:MAG: 16S rRNA (uracil(1498)-N(3))-methyltransferase [Bacteroidales bacterium]|nr:16S rRNA (uracil(1498)-N(3))-methyltransferase [Bacteroidales bacterium]
MELFYAYKIDGSFAYLDAEESAHCVKVLRHRTGDRISLIAATGGLQPYALYNCIITDDSQKGVIARVDSVLQGWGAHSYHLRMAVCPTKNIDRFEWFVEKATELGVDEIIPVIGDHSERRVVRSDRLKKIAVSAAKQSLKGAVPVIAEPMSVTEFVKADASGEIRLIAYCSDDVAPRGSIMDALAEALPSAAEKRLVRAPEKGARYQHSPAVETLAHASAGASRVTVLIGPEGDFSQDEVRAALTAGFTPVHLGPSRLRTETAALTAVEAVYLSFLRWNTTPYESND